MRRRVESVRLRGGATAVAVCVTVTVVVAVMLMASASGAAGGATKEVGESIEPSCVLAPGVLNIPTKVKVALRATAPEEVEPDESLELTSISASVTLPKELSEDFVALNVHEVRGHVTQLPLNGSLIEPAQANLAKPAAYPSGLPFFESVQREKTLSFAAPSLAPGETGHTYAFGPLHVTGGKGAISKLSVDTAAAFVEEGETVYAATGKGIVVEIEGFEESGSKLIGPLTIACTAPPNTYAELPIATELGPPPPPSEGPRAIPGQVSAWGDDVLQTTQVPALVGGVKEVAAISAGDEFSLALLQNGTVEAWGYNEYGQLGRGSLSGRFPEEPAPVDGLSEVAAVSAGSAYSLAALKSGAVVAWGGDENGQMRNEVTPESDLPVPVSGISEAVAVSAGFGESLALLKSGHVMAWGSNEDGQLGNGTTTSSATPEEVPGLSEVVAVQAGNDHALALLRNGTVMAWGALANGGLPLGTTTERCVDGTECSTTPRPVAGLSEVTAIAGNVATSAALLRNGTVMAWGSNFLWQLGDGSRETSETPVRVGSLTGVVAISEGYSHGLALLNSGTVMAWGENGNGDVGDGTTEVREVPVPVTGLTSPTAISAGQSFSLALGGTLLAVPVVSALTPASGPPVGGTSVLITGANFDGATAVKFGAKNAAGFSVESDGQILATSPPGSGVVAVTVSTPEGTSAVGPSTGDRFSYVAPPTVTNVSPHEVGDLGACEIGEGVEVTITGTGFTGTTAVHFGSAPAESFQIVSETEIKAVTPFKPSGGSTFDVTVTNAEGTSPTSPADQFSYKPRPDVTSVEPNEGPSTGGTHVIIHGTNLNSYPILSLSFGPHGASYEGVSSNEIRAVSPPGTGTVQVGIVTPACNPQGTASFTYTEATKLEYNNWTLSGSLTPKRLGQPIALPSGSTFSGNGQFSAETGSGSLTASLGVPAFKSTLKLFGAIPMSLGLTLSQAGPAEGKLARSETVSGDEVLSIPVKLKVGITSVGLLGLSIPTKCATAESLSLTLSADVAGEELLTKGWGFGGSASLPRIKCEGGLLGTAFGVVLSGLLSGPETVYALTIRPPA